MVNAFVTLSMATAVGLIALQPLAAGLDAIEKRRCPGVNRVQMAAVGSSWGRWGACPPHITSLPE
jgi:hypothetical protein